MKPVIRLKPPSKVILEEYSNDPNEAIILLQNRVKVLQKASETTKNLSKSGQKPSENAPIGDSPGRFSLDSIPSTLPRDHPYWKTLKEVVDEALVKAREGW